MKKNCGLIFLIGCGLFPIGLVAGSDVPVVDIQTVQNQYRDRQQENLFLIAQSDDIPVERGAALLFLNQDIGQANSFLLSFDHQETESLQCSLILRLLHAFQGESNQLREDIRIHLETEIAAWIAAQSTSPNPVHVPESQDILETSIRLLWASHVERATPEYTWPDKQSNKKHKELSVQKARRWMEQRIRYGFTDRSSPANHFSLAAFLNLRDFPEEPAFVPLAEASIDILIADLVLESLESQWGGVHCRDLETFYPLPCNRMQNIFFGWPMRSESFPLSDSLVLHLCHSTYQPPAVLVRLAREYRTRGIYEIKNRINRNPTAPEKDPGHKYSYVTPSYILSSFRLHDESVPWHSRPWDLMILDDQNDGHHLFSLTGNELASGGIQSLDDEYYLWNASCFQYKNVLFCRFGRCDRKRANAANDDEFIDLRYVQLPTRLWIPNVFAPITQEGVWWFCQMDAIYLAFRPLSGRSYWWRTNDSDDAGDGASILTFQDLGTSLVLEVEQASHFTSFEQFKNQVMNSPLEIDNDSITFVSRRGDVFLFPLDDGDFLVNGRVENPVEDTAYRLFSSPFIQSDYGSGFLKAEWQTYSLTIDIRDPENPKRIVEPN